MEDILGMDNNSEIQKAWIECGYTDVLSFWSIGSYGMEMKDLYFKDDGDKSTLLKAGNVGLLNVLQKFLNYWENSTSSYLDTKEVYHLINPEDFDGFRIKSFKDIKSEIPSPPRTHQIQNPQKWSDAVIDFRKGMKQDTYLFPELRDFAQWDNWDAEFTTITTVQNCVPILDPSYIPSTSEDIELFK